MHCARVPMPCSSSKACMSSLPTALKASVHDCMHDMTPATVDIHTGCFCCQCHEYCLFLLRVVSLVSPLPDLLCVLQQEVGFPMPPSSCLTPSPGPPSKLRWQGLLYLPSPLLHPQQPQHPLPLRFGCPLIMGTMFSFTVMSNHPVKQRYCIL